MMDLQSSNHFDPDGAARMVDVSAKAATERRARASGRVRMLAATCRRIRDQQFAKGDVLAVARLAGIMAAKQTSNLIPLCHPLPLESLEVDFAFSEDTASGDAWVEITAEVSVAGKTGVEMEALMAVSHAALTIYDMCKSVDRGMVLEAILLDEKSGGRSGTYRRDSE